MQIDQNLANILLSGLLASILSAIITSLLNIFYQKKSEKKQLDDTLMQLNTFLVNEPFLENDLSLERYMTDNEMENKLKRDKYNLYCIMKYNYLEDFCQYYQYNLKKIKSEINIKEYFKDNEKWWNENRKINYESYNKKFIQLIEEVVNES
jgi:hypothetical protein